MNEIHRFPLTHGFHFTPEMLREMTLKLPWGGLSMKLVLFVALGLIAQLSPCWAQNEDSYRWTGEEDSNPSLSHVIELLNLKSGKVFSPTDFLLQEDRPLAFSHYQNYQQISGGVPVEGKSIRIWSNRETGKTIQVEASLELSFAQTPGRERLNHFYRFTLDESDTMDQVRDALKKSPNDQTLRSINWTDRVVNGALIRLVTVKTTHGKHLFSISHQTQKIVEHRYEEFPQMDLEALVYPIYEEVEGSDGTLLPRVKSKLTHLLSEVPTIHGDLYSELKTRRYFDFNFSPILGSTEEGRAQGYWSMSDLKTRAQAIRMSLPKVENSFTTGLLLQGEYATINIHPDAFKNFTGIAIPAQPTAAFLPSWIPSTLDGKEVYEMIPGNAFAGKPLTSAEELFTRPARRLPNHDPTTYINDGFDEIQVYYAINTLMEALHQRGLSDPDLSTRPFNAFLFNPDVEYRDNAFYTDDTINFTTYSPTKPNMARDNSTIWHELGHGIMDRLMGDSIHLADTGGLSEGMADFVAQIVVQAVSQSKPFPGLDQFRIINHTGFFLTNEVHDDGEAYGGAMNDFMLASIARFGERGLTKVGDVILEAMRLCRDHPGLTAKDWFAHILFADHLGRPGLREPGELSPMLLTALHGRNFSLNDTKVASFSLVNHETGSEVLAGADGSRGHAIQVKIAKDETYRTSLDVRLKSSQNYSFHYPVTVKIEFQKGPLQGAIHWIGEEKGTQSFILNSEAETLSIPIEATGTCDFVNRQDGSCVDYAYVQVLSVGEQDRPQAKKRFYLQIRNP
jgi:hypothetical protein